MINPRLGPGEGICKVARSGRQAVFGDLQFSFPLKLIVPARHFVDGTACVYVISYGGGLVAGDRVHLRVEVSDGMGLVMLTQGSTKVFRVREGRFPTATMSPDGTEPNLTRQEFEVTIADHSSLFLLPSPVTCFSRARYSQSQVFRISSSSNLVLLDWYTSGRMSLAGTTGGEEWDFERFRSQNEVFVDGKRVAKDVQLLEDERLDQSKARATYLCRVEPYSCYATLMILGPALQPILAHLKAAFDSITQYPQSRPYSMLWSFTSLQKGSGGIARCAGASSEEVKEWIVQILTDGGIEDLIGRDLWSNAFS